MISVIRKLNREIYFFGKKKNKKDKAGIIKKSIIIANLTCAYKIDTLDFVNGEKPARDVNRERLIYPKHTVKQLFRSHLELQLLFCINSYMLACCVCVN